MSSDIVLTAALRNNLLSLQNTQRSIDDTQLRLATGLRVNSALDNPQSFFTAQNLNNRANDLTRLLDGISQSIRTIEEADNGITALTRLVEQADAVSTEALSEVRAGEGFARIRGTEDLRGVDLVADTAIDAGDQFQLLIEESDGTQTTITTTTINAGNTVDNIVANINSAANNTDLVQASVTDGGQLQIVSLVDGAVLRLNDSADSGAGGTELDQAGFSALGLGDFVGAENSDDATAVRFAGTAIAGSTVSSQASGAAKVNGVFEASATLSAAGFLNTGAAGVNELEVIITADGQSSAAINLAKDTTIQEFIDGINNDATLGDDVSARFNTDTGVIDIQTDGNVGQIELQFQDLTGTANPQFEFGRGDADGALGGAGNFDSEFFNFVGTSIDLEQFESDFNSLREQITDIVEDARFRGVNLLNGDNLITTFNEDSTNTLTTQGQDFSAVGLGLDEANFTTAASVQLSIDDVEAALSRIRNFGQSIANDLAVIQTRRDFTEQTINTLQSGADDLTVADQNEEGANLLALQTRQQLGVTSLALAAQSQQAVLRLF